MPNLIEGAPPGGEDDYVVLREVGDKPSSPSRSTTSSWARGSAAIDVERGAKVSGSRFYFLTGVGALLELALQQMAVAQGRGRRVSPR